MKLTSISLLFFSLLNCTLHHYKIGNQAVRIFASPEWKEKRKVSLERKNTPEDNGKKDNTIATSYNSQGINDYLRRGCCLEIDEKSNLQVKYSTNVKDDLLYAPTVFLWMFTLGIIPVFEKIEADIKIEVFDAANQQLLKEYNYSINERAYNSWLTIPISLLLITNDSFAHSFIHMFDYPQKFIANRFEKDFLEDLAAGKFSEAAISQTTKKNNSTRSRIAILPIKHQFSKDASVANAIRDKVETVLVNKNYTVVERVKLDEILKELKLSQTGLTTSDQVKIGNMINASNLILGEIIEVNRNDTSLEFSIRNIEMETGKILWKHEFSIDEQQLTPSLNQAMKDFDLKLRAQN
jgi:hypothetical protein